MADQNLNIPGVIEEPTDKSKMNMGTGAVPNKKKKSGCGCCLFGCLLLLILFFAPPVATVVYVASLSDAQLGAKIVFVAKNPNFAKGFKNGLASSKSLSDVQKKTLTAVYDSFLTTYDQLQPNQQEKVNADIVAVIRYLAKNPDAKQPPAEFTELLQFFSGGKSPINSLNTNTPLPPANTNTPGVNTTSNNSDPYSFDLPSATTTPQTQQQPQTQPQVQTPQPTTPTQTNTTTTKPDGGKFDF